jgi:hypothetical protein
MSSTLTEEPGFPVSSKEKEPEFFDQLLEGKGTSQQSQGHACMCFRK